MRFLLIYPPPESFFIQSTRVFFGLSPPLGLLYVAKMLQNNGNIVTILDFSAEQFDEQKLRTATHNTDAVGISVLSSSITQVKKINQLIQKQRPNIPIIIGGPHCTLLPEKSLIETQAHICVQGDSETIIPDLVKALNKEKKFSDIPGVYTPTNKGMIQGSSPQTTKNLDNIPFPSRELVSHYIYGREYNPHLKEGEFTSIITSRGCPYHCRFCSRGSISMQQYRTRSTKNIMMELREIKKQGYRHVVISDDCFPANTKQASRLFEAIIQEELSLKFSVTATRVDFADEELYTTMRQAGVTHMQYGLESGNQDVLDFYQKNTTVETIRDAVHLSHTNGFFTMGSFIFGAPFETQEHFNRTLTFAKTLPLDSVSFLPLRYMVGSELWNQAVAEGKISEDEYLVIADKNRGLGNFTKDELLRHCLRAQRSFYGRPIFFINLLKKSLHNDDFSYVQSYLSFISSSLRGFLH